MQTSPLIIFACSGPGAMAAIHQNIVIGYICAGIGALITGRMALSYLLTRRVRLPMIFAAALLLIHPACKKGSARKGHKKGSGDKS